MAVDAVAARWPGANVRPARPRPSSSPRTGHLLDALSLLGRSCLFVALTWLAFAVTFGLLAGTSEPTYLLLP